MAGELRKVRTTIRPDEDLEVNEAEYENLLASGLVKKTDDKPVVASVNAPAGTQKEVKKNG